MKRVNGIYDRIISVENLELADRRARRGKLRSYGVRRHDRHREEEILALHESLRDGTFRTSPYTVFTVEKPKRREIYRLPYYPDRIVHHAVMNVVQPLWDSVLTYNTYSCVRGRGIHACVRRVDGIIRSFEGRELYCLKLDIRKFYPSVDHEVMKRIVRRKIKDRRALRLLDDIIDSTAGLPIGNYTSQYLSNLYLAYFMHWVNETLGARCVEYADDLVFFSDSKEELHGVRERVTDRLARELRLETRGNWQVFPVAERKGERGRGLDFVGYVFYRRHRGMRKSIKRNLCRRAARLNRLALTPERYRRRICPWLGWAKHCDARNLLKKAINNSEVYEILFKRKAKRA